MTLLLHTLRLKGDESGDEDEEDENEDESGDEDEEDENEDVFSARALMHGVLAY